MSYFDKFTINLQKAIKVSSDAAKHFGSSYIGSEHILFGILNVPECRACKLLKAAGVNEGAYRAVFVRSLDKNTKVAGFTPRTKNMFERACEFALATARAPWSAPNICFSPFSTTKIPSPSAF